MSTALTKTKEILYPERDGKPMGETDTHRNWIMWLISMLKSHFAGQPVYVTGDLLLYYEEGNPRRFVVPDLFIVKNHPPGDRRPKKAMPVRLLVIGNCS